MTISQAYDDNADGGKDIEAVAGATMETIEDETHSCSEELLD